MRCVLFWPGWVRVGHSSDYLLPLFRFGFWTRNNNDGRISPQRPQMKVIHQFYWWGLVTFQRVINNTFSLDVIRNVFIHEWQHIQDLKHGWRKMINTDPQSLRGFKKKFFSLRWRWSLSQHPSTDGFSQHLEMGLQVEGQKNIRIISNPWSRIHPYGCFQK